MPTPSQSTCGLLSSLRLRGDWGYDPDANQTLRGVGYPVPPLRFSHSTECVEDSIDLPAR